MLPDGYDLRALTLDDAAALAAAYGRNRDHLAPWDPVRPESFYTEAAQRSQLLPRMADLDRGEPTAWAVWHGAELVGRVNLNNLVRGVFQSSSVGYWVAGAHTGRGLARAMVGHAADAATAMGLHRLEAGTLLHNVASQRVLEACGFTRFGTAERYLFIAGEWRDHVLFQRILHDRPLD